jgi:hypothetical protein
MNTIDDRRYYVTGLILPTGLALAAVAPGGHAAKVPAVPATDAPTPAHTRAYEHVYGQVVRKFGPRAPGRNIIKDGFAAHEPATDAETVASTAVLRRMLAPAPAAVTPTQSTASSTRATSRPAASSGAGGVPACASESGSNYSTGASNTNSSSGATGRYQITPSTAANYGCNLATAGGQDACAQTIYTHQGASAWVGCGG